MTHRFADGTTASAPDQRVSRLRGRTANSSVLGIRVASLEPSNRQKKQAPGPAAYFFRTPLMWNSATDFPAMLLGTISV